MITINFIDHNGKIQASQENEKDYGRMDPQSIIINTLTRCMGYRFTGFTFELRGLMVKCDDATPETATIYVYKGAQKVGSFDAVFTTGYKGGWKLTDKK